MRLHRKYVFFVVILSALSAYTQLCGAPSGEAQGLTSSELSRLRSVGSVELSPDGRRIAYTVTMRDRPGRPSGQLWIMAVASQKSARVGGYNNYVSDPLASLD